ncbi:hypothetical protein GCM10009828_076200 [Actinoplanes couchii]|uniref:Signal transduction histidine kinase n=2 Tax=Actinoplanes couchii TaxID=403638 RepID=A0ABQ3WZH1_9ACTN|nr:hypothetical protein Aco03nite_000760 [Actinoplanes couchii]
MSGVLLIVLYRTEALDDFGSGEIVIRRAAYLASVVAWLGAAALLSLRPPPGRFRRVPAIVLGTVTFGATVAVTVTVPTGLQHTSANWAVGVNGWLLLTVLSGARFWPAVLVLAGPVLVALGVAGATGPAEAVAMTARALGILGLQVPVALAALTLERSAEEARERHLAQEAIRTARIVADALHDDRMRRSRTVAAAVEPVLARLADPVSGDGPDDTLRQRSPVAAAQVRRLLNEWYQADDDPLGADLSARLDGLQAAGTWVEVAVHTGALPAELRRAACDVVRECARHSVRHLRLTAVPGTGQVCLSVVARIEDLDPDLTLGDVPQPLTIRTTAIDETLWVELTCPV